MNLFSKIVTTIAIVGFSASAASACPGNLRSFNKKLGGKDTCILEDTLVGDVTLTSGFNYIVLGDVYVGKERRKVDSNGDFVLAEPIVPATLTIQPGVRIYALNPSKDTSGIWDGVSFRNGSPVGTADVKSFISVTRDSKIFVNGTTAAPVLMTSAQGEYTRPGASVSKKNPGDWGGLVINGYGKSNKCTKFEGCTLPGEANTGFYAGNDNNHSSGSLRYLQVEYGGDRIDDKKELNGVTFNAIGLGTKIENVAVLYNSDDCIEFFGGAAVAKNIFCYKGEDDGIDTTDGARLMIQRGIVVASAFTADNAKNDRHAVEADSSKNATVHKRLGSNPILVNFTFVGAKNSQGLKLRRGTGYTLVNSVMVGVDLWCLDNSDSPGELNLYGNTFVGCKNSDPIKSFNDNTFLADSSLLNLQGWVPQAGSPLLTGATDFDVFDDDKSTDPADQEDLDMAFDNALEFVDYVGAVGDTDWTSWIELK